MQANSAGLHDADQAQVFDDLGYHRLGVGSGKQEGVLWANYLADLFRPTSNGSRLTES